MKFNNPDFIIKEDNRLDDGMEYILRRYKGNGGVVEIPEGVTQIENNIFGDDIEPNKTVTKIIMPDSVTDIEMDAFSFCEKLTEIIFSKNLRISKVFWKNLERILKAFPGISKIKNQNLNSKF